MLDCLYLTYRQFAPLDIKENDLNMRKQYNQVNSVGILYKKIDDGKIAAVARSSYTMQQIVNILEAVIILTGV